MRERNDRSILPSMSRRVSEPDALCAACVEQLGLCARHAPGVLPQLKQPSWYRLVGEAHYAPKATPESPAARKVRERKERKRARKRAIAAHRLLEAVAGRFSRSSPAREAA